MKKVFLEISQNSQENTCARVSFFNKVAGLKNILFWKNVEPLKLKHYMIFVDNKLKKKEKKKKKCRGLSESAPF